MRDFFARQQQARRSTLLLISYFIAAVILIVLGVYFSTRGIYLYASTSAYEYQAPPIHWWDLRWFSWTAGSTAAIILAGTTYQIGQLRRGGRRLAELLDARKLASNSSELYERRLLNIVEEMAIASGIPVPEVFVMDRERGINAFAAGSGVGDGIVCVTKGALELLDREELQGVVAHEFSHLLNGDSLINLRLIGWLYGILLLHQIGASLLRGIADTESGRGKGPLVAVGLILWIIGYLGYVCGQLIKSAISRQREHLADASAVQFTRNPLGLAGALKKIGGLELGSRLRHPMANLASHMYFGEGVKSAWWDAFATHPPLDERIRLLDPVFDGRYPEVKPLPAPEPHPGYVQKPRAVIVENPVFSGTAVLALLAQVGQPQAAHAARARELLAALPEDLRDAARDPADAVCLLQALLIDRDPELRARQLGMLDGDAAGRDRVAGLLERLDGMDEGLRLPLVDLALPALRALSPPQYRSLRRRLGELSRADGRLSLFEYALEQLLRQSLDRQFGKPAKTVIQYYAVRGVRHEAAVMLSLLARIGHDNEQSANRAFAHGARVLSEPKLQLQLLPAADCRRRDLDAALGKLRQTSPPLRRKLLAACLETLGWDDRVTRDEIELFRALAAALEVPVPPWLELPAPT